MPDFPRPKWNLSNSSQTMQIAAPIGTFRWLNPCWRRCAQNFLADKTWVGLPTTFAVRNTAGIDESRMHLRHDRTHTEGICWPGRVRLTPQSRAVYLLLKVCSWFCFSFYNDELRSSRTCAYRIVRFSTFNIHFTLITSGDYFCVSISIKNSRWSDRKIWFISRPCFSGDSGSGQVPLVLPFPTRGKEYLNSSPETQKTQLPLKTPSVDFISCLLWRVLVWRIHYRGGSRVHLFHFLLLKCPHQLLGLDDGTCERTTNLRAPTIQDGPGIFGSLVVVFSPPIQPFIHN